MAEENGAGTTFSLVRYNNPVVIDKEEITTRPKSAPASTGNCYWGWVTWWHHCQRNKWGSRWDPGDIGQHLATQRMGGGWQTMETECELNPSHQVNMKYDRAQLQWPSTSNILGLMLWTCRSSWTSSCNRGKQERQGYVRSRLNTTTYIYMF